MDVTFLADDSKEADTLRQDLFKEYYIKDHPTIFQAEDELHLAKDGGLQDVSSLWQNDCLDWVKGLSLLFLILLNLCVTLNYAKVTIIDDLSAAWVHSDTFDDLLGAFLGPISNTNGFFLGRRFLPPRYANLELKLVPLLEVSYFFFLIGGAALDLKRGWRAMFVQSQVAPDDEKWNDLQQRWKSVARLFLDWLPALRVASAVQVLYHCQPAVFAFDIKHLLNKVQNKKENEKGLRNNRHVYKLIAHCIKLTICFVVGTEALRIKMAHLDGSTPIFTFFIFIYQILAISNTSKFVKLRLRLFIFEGEDGKLSLEEEIRWETWEAILCQRIYAKHGRLAGSIVMLKFNDYDIQRLLLEDKRSEERRRESPTKQRSLFFGSLLDWTHHPPA